MGHSYALNICNAVSIFLPVFSRCFPIFPIYNILAPRFITSPIICTYPAMRNYPINFINELVGTFVLMLTIFYIAGASLTLPGETAATPVGLGSIGALPVAITVWAIGLSLGATTGYAINPARDLGPRIVLACVPLRTDPDWAYSWVPVLGPCAGGVLAAVVFKALS